MSCNFSPLLQSVIANAPKVKIEDFPQNALDAEPSTAQPTQEASDTFVSNKSNKSKLPKRLALGGGIGAAVGFLGNFGALKGLECFYKNAANGKNSKFYAGIATDFFHILLPNEKDMGHLLEQLLKMKIENPTEFIETIKTSEEQASKLLRNSGEVLGKLALKSSAKGALVMGAIGLGTGAIVHLVKRKSDKES